MADSQGWQAGASCCHMGFSVGILEFSHNIALDFPRMSDPREPDRSCSVFCDLALEVMLCVFPVMLLVTQVSPVRHGKALYKGTDTWSGITRVYLRGHHSKLYCVLPFYWSLSTPGFSFPFFL